MKRKFEGWEAIADRLRRQAEEQEQVACEKGEAFTRLNQGQRAGLRAIALRIVTNGVVLAYEVGMGKTRIAVEVCGPKHRCNLIVVQSG